DLTDGAFLLRRVPRTARIGGISRRRGTARNGRPRRGTVSLNNRFKPDRQLPELPLTAVASNKGEGCTLPLHQPSATAVVRSQILASRALMRLMAIGGL